MNEMIEAFAAVVEYGSLNRASRILNISQPALSRKIAKLEEELNVTLFERKGKKLVLTGAGQMTCDYAVELRRIKKQFQQQLSQFKTEQRTKITIGASLTTLQSTLPDLITLYNREIGLADINAVTGKTHEIVSLVQEKKVDLGLVASAIKKPGLLCIPLFDDHLSLVLPRSHSSASKLPVHIEQLQKLPMILFSKGTWYRILMDELFNRYGIFPEIKMEIDSFEAIIRLVHTCNAATLLPTSYLRQNLLDDNELAMLQIHELKQTTRTTSLIYRDSEPLHPSVKQWIEKAELFFKMKP
jgi:DNA-binding transcriptional LysR family regulator